MIAVILSGIVGFIAGVFATMMFIIVMDDKDKKSGEK